MNKTIKSVLSVNFASFLITFLLLFCFTDLVGQKRFEAGSISNAEGEQLNGWISTAQDSYGISFKQNSNDKVTTYYPENISGYTFGNTLYKSAKISLRSPADVQSKSVFLETLVQGKLNLYRFYEKSGVEHFIAEKNNEFHELRVVNERRKSDENARELYIFKRNEYIAELFFLTQDCSKVTVSDKNIRFNQNDLTRFVIEYNNCFAPTLSAIQTNKKDRSRTFLSFGLHLGNGSYSRKKVDFMFGNTPLNSVIPQPANSFLFGGFLEFPMSKSNKNLFAKIEYNYYNASDGVTLNANDKLGFYPNKQVIGLITYRFRQYTFEPYASFGAGYKYNSRVEGTFGRKNMFVDSDLPFLFEAGMNYKRFFIAARYQKTYTQKDTFFYILGGYSLPIIKTK